MRTILRVGITIGGIAFVTLYALQSAIALAVAPGIIVAGVCAGLGTAKWLERPWFGRQFSAGLRAGIIAVGMAGVGALLALLAQGSHSIDQLAERSHLYPVDLGPAIITLSGVGWVGVDILLVSLAVAAGIAASGIITQVGAWTKSQRAIKVVAQARFAAQGPAYDERAGVSGLFGVAGTPTSTPARVSPPPRQAGSSSPFEDQPWDQPIVPPAAPPRFQQTEPTPQEATQRRPSNARFQQIEPTPKAAVQRRPSKARPAETQLNEAMREALATWAGDNAGAAPADPRSGSAEGTRVRTPQPSEYLNSTPPASGKRSRKKQNTEWLR